MTRCEFFVAGEPVAQPRLRPRMSRDGRLGVCMPRSAEGWRMRVLLAARAEWSGPPSVAPLAVQLDFVLPRRATHMTARGQVRASAPAWPTVKPDVDNLAKSTLDACNGLLWRDDAQVTSLAITKAYVDEFRPEPGVFVSVEVCE